MSMALQARVSTLEATTKAQADEIEALRFTVRELIDTITAKPVNPNGPRQMCPKCGEKPNYFLHVRSCKGKG